MSGLYVDSSNMEASGSRTLEDAETFANQINELSSNVDSLMTIWRSASATKFKEATEEQAANLNSFREVLTIFGDKIRENAKRFDQIEEENTSNASNLF